MADVDLFRDEYLPNIQAATITFAGWKKRYPAEFAAWVVYRDAVLAGDEFPELPTMVSRLGKALVAAGQMAERYDMEVALSTSGGSSNLSGTVTVTATVTPSAQATGTVKCQWYVDGSYVVTDTSYPLSFSWNTTLVSEGSHVLRADVLVKNRLRKATLTVTVKNIATPPPPPPPPPSDDPVEEPPTPPPVPPPPAAGILTGAHWVSTGEYAAVKAIGYQFAITTLNQNDSQATWAQVLDAAQAAGIKLIVGAYAGGINPPEGYSYNAATGVWTISAATTNLLNYLESRESEIIALFVYNEPLWLNPLTGATDSCGAMSATQLRGLRTKIQTVWPNAKIYHDLGLPSQWAPGGLLANSYSCIGQKYATMTTVADYVGFWYYPFRSTGYMRNTGLSTLAAEASYIVASMGAVPVFLGQGHSGVEGLVWPTDAQLSDWNTAVRAALPTNSLISWYVWRQSIYPDVLANHPSQWPLTVGPAAPPPPATTFPTAAVLDEFTRANAGTLGAGWNENIYAGCPSLGIVSNQAKQAAAYKSSYWGTQLNANQEAYMTIVARSDLTRLCARLQNPNTGTESLYFISVYADGSAYLEKGVAGVTTTLQALGGIGTISAGEKIGISVSGTTIRCYKGVGSTWTQMGTNQTDSSVAGAGYAGVYQGNATTGIVDSFGGGNI